MSEERLSAELDGTGGGFGKFAGKSVRELTDLFQQQMSEPNMRSLTAVLRITREQIEARGSLTVFPVICLILGCLTAGLGAGYLLCPEGSKKTVLQVFLGAAIVFVLTMFGWLSNRRQQVASVAQERAIRRLAVETLIRIVDDPQFRPKPLDWSQQQILKELLKKTGAKNEALSAMLES